ncbi:hypothetical protein GCM10009789_39080 [Kribbella sancticallisti]|uniref:DUF3592 domain-containing protein n=1 Tax=Kribbella sancticallisti TaxID=460087 RepID=A0ABP4PHP5_9ACTN
MAKQSLGKAAPGFRAQLMGLILMVGVSAWMLVLALDSSVPLDAPSVRGTVVDVVEHRKRRSIKVEYVLPDGRQFSAKTSECGYEDRVVGREVVVRYDPADPKDVAIGDFQEYDTLYLSLTGLFGLGAAFMIGRAIYYAARK